MSEFLAGWRFLFMPAGLFCLVAVGVHAAADTVDDRLLWFVDQVDAFFDGVFGAWPNTAPFVDLIDLEDRSRIARTLALSWELGALLVLAGPALGYRERPRTSALSGVSALVGTPSREWAGALGELFSRPSALRTLRPLGAFAIIIAGACAVARMVQSTLYLAVREWFPSAFASGISRGIAVGSLLSLLLVFGMRTVLRNLEYADRLAAKAEATEGPDLFKPGLWGTLILSPLALAALWDASPLLSFFR